MIFHITTNENWQKAIESDEYSSNSLASEGFIHCSTLNQLIKVANAFYRGQNNLIILCIESEKLKAVVQWESPSHLPTDTPPSVDTEEKFPHVYGMINLDAVVSIVPLKPSSDGLFELPAILHPNQTYHVIYDGNCHLCVTFTQLLEKFDQGKLFNYIPMQDEKSLQQFAITAEDCQMGMILIDAQNPQKRWQGSDAAEEIIAALPMGKTFISAYRSLPGVKLLGDKTYEQMRDNRYQWFGKRDSTYHSAYPFGCKL